MSEVGLVPFARVALEVSWEVMPAYSHRFSPQRFTQPQLLAILCLMRYEDWTFRAAEVRLAEHGELRRALELQTVPDYSTLFRFMLRVEEQVIAQVLALAWAESALPGPIVYGFWRGRRCLYIGKGGSWRRLKSYEKSAYLLQATRIKAFCITTQSNLPKAECLATHLFDPRDKKMKPAKVKWGKKCPVCREHDFVQHQVQNLFKLK